ncbi:MAG: phosphonate metabolism protein PhnP [Motiliproteus sp.]
MAILGQPPSLAIRTHLGTTLIDAGNTDLAERYAFDAIRRIVLTHFHMDHVQGLFHLRWSERTPKIPVYRPDDPLGADDLYKHPGVLDFQPPFEPFQATQWDDFSITALPLQHSKITLGYLLQTPEVSVAYLTDTFGLPETTEVFLRRTPLDYLIIDCSEPPGSTPPRNHNDLNQALKTQQQLQPKKLILTHISHRLDRWLIDNPQKIPSNVIVATDGLVLS